MKEYYWWNVAETIDYYLTVFRLAFTIGAKNVRVEFHESAEGCLDPKHNGEPIHRVIDARSGAVVGEYNVVYVCPPFCPE